jgi:hypothetical protein
VNFFAAHSNVLKALTAGRMATRSGGEIYARRARLACGSRTILNLESCESSSGISDMRRTSTPSSCNFPEMPRQGLFGGVGEHDAHLKQGVS